MDRVVLLNEMQTVVLIQNFQKISLKRKVLPSWNVDAMARAKAATLGQEI